MAYLDYNGKMVDNRIADLAQWDLGGGWRARVDTDLSGRNQGKHVHVYDIKGNWTYVNIVDTFF